MCRLVKGYLKRFPRTTRSEDGAEPDVSRCPYTPYALRATTAALLLGAGIDIRKVQELLGHRRVTTTQIYDNRRISAPQRRITRLAGLKRPQSKKMGG
jgi:integrase